MKRRTDYLEMQKQLQQLESKIIPGDENFDALQRRLADVGSNAVITKTNYWHWLIEKDDLPESYFYATPPIGEVYESDRILITGTKAETRDMQEILRGLEVYKRVMSEIQSKRKKLPGGNIVVARAPLDEPCHELAVATSSLEQYGVKPVYAFCGSVGSFWANFFGEGQFLDCLDKISAPRAIIGTGSMRNYNRFGGETIEVKGRLEEIASAWDIPVQFIESWAL